MVEEKRELDVKLEKLKAFALTQIFLALPVEEQRRLLRQAGIMVDYSGVLGERIAAFQ